LNSDKSKWVSVIQPKTDGAVTKDL
jgi:hypothetical protein